jgi:hypothetical protein
VPIHFADESFSKTYVSRNGTSDFTVLRARAVMELQFRAEFFNVLNQPNFSPSVVNNDLYSANGAAVTSARLITATSTSSRQLQFASKIAW